MNRVWVGIGVLVLFLGVGLWAANAMEEAHGPISEALAQASEAALSGDLEAAGALVSQAHRDWQAHWHGTAAVADHASMDEIDSLFAQTEVYLRTGAAADFAAGCARLSALVRAMGDAHAPSWWNLL